MTTSAPSASGCCSNGVANVLSQATMAPCACASLVSAAISQMCNCGLEGVSSQRQRVFGVNALLTASRSAVSTALADRPRCGRNSRCQHTQAGVAVPRVDDMRARRQTLEQRGDRRHARSECQRAGAAFERGKRGFQALLIRIALAHVFESGHALACGPVLERRGKMQRRRNGAGGGVGSRAGVNGEGFKAHRHFEPPGKRRAPLATYPRCPVRCARMT